MAYKGSLTVFLSLTTLMIVSLILSLVELVHFKMLNAYTETVSDIAIESGFGDFNRVMLEDYGILAVDMGYCSPDMRLDKFEARMLGYMQDNLDSEGVSFLRAMPNHGKVKGYGLLTDNSGAAFIKEAAKDMEYRLPSVLIEKLKEVTNESSFANGDSDVDIMLNDSANSVKYAESSGETGGGEQIESPLNAEEQRLLEENGSPVDNAMEWRGKAVLAQVVGDTEALSKETISSSGDLELRAKNAETDRRVTVTPGEKMLYAAYLKTSFGNYTKLSRHKGITYEWEYVLNGKSSDIENLEATVLKLLAQREAANLAYLISDTAKLAEAESISTAICAGLAMPALIEPVKWGIVAAWAYLESVLDVRLLLAGGRAPVIKTKENWTSNILLLPSYMDTSVMAKESEAGLSYEDYLMAMTVISPVDKLGIRGLELIENAIRQNRDYSEIRMENFVYCVEAEYEYEASPVFATLTPMTGGLLKNYKFSFIKKLSYL